MWWIVGWIVLGCIVGPLFGAAIHRFNPLD